ncbi:MAG: hypothetical protein ACLP2X_18475 [Syntrophobacteraceae bacterium]
MRHEELVRKVSVGFAALSPSYGPFHGFRVSRRDVSNCYEKTVFHAKTRRREEVPMRHEELLRKGRPQGARLRLGQASFYGLGFPSRI